MFVPIQKGVYRHAVLGLFKDLQAAKDAGTKSILEEQDHYHDVEILEVSEDHPGEVRVGTLSWNTKCESVFWRAG